MNTIKLLLGVVLLSFMSCSSIKTPQTSSHLASLEGKAQDTKAGAVIVTQDSLVYYLDGVEYWASKYQNKWVVVIGEVVFVEEKESTDSTLMVQSTPSKRLILTPFYKLK